MANVKISQLPQYTGNTAGSWLIMNNSGETTTYKVTKETLIGASGTSGTSGTGGSSGTSGTGGSSGTSGTSGDSIFAQTGSFWNTTRNVGITGSFNVTGSVTIKGVSNNIAGTTLNYINSNTLGAGANIIESKFGYNQISGSYNIIQGDNRLTGSLISSGSSHKFIGPTEVTGSLVASGSLHKFIGSQNNSGSFEQSGSIYITGSVQGNVNALSISSNTASLNLDNGNFFTLQLVSGSATHINPSNIKPGQTVNIRVNTTGSATVNFPSSVKQISGSAYVPTTTTGVDVLTLISFDSSNVYLANVKNLI